MKYFALTLVVTLGIICNLSAQYAAVNYDIRSNWFNQGQQLPAETDMILTGQTSKDTEVIKVSILPAKGDEKDALHIATWYRSGKGDEISLPINYKLRSNSTYDFQLDFFRPVDRSEKKVLRDRMVAVLHAFIEAKQKDGASIDFTGSSRKLVRQMNELISKLLTNYHPRTGNWDYELSEIVELKFERMESANLVREYDKKDTTTSKQSLRKTMRIGQMEEMRSILAAEVDRILDMELLELSESRFIDDYMTENKPGSLSLNFGYGASFLSGKLTDGAYGTAPYVGLAIPLGHQVLGTKFFRNASLVAGVFIDPFEGVNGQDVNGFLLKQPIYLGLDYKLFQFVHFNAGAAMLDGNTLDMEGIDLGSDQKLAIRPFIGLSARVNLSLSLGK